MDPKTWKLLSEAPAYLLKARDKYRRVMDLEAYLRRREAAMKAYLDNGGDASALTDSALADRVVFHTIRAAEDKAHAELDVAENHYLNDCIATTMEPGKLGPYPTCGGSS